MRYLLKEMKNMVLICNSKRKDVLSSTSLMLIVFICIITISSCRNKKQETTKEIYDLENHEFKLPKYNFFCNPNFILATARVIFRVTKVSPRNGDS